MPYRDSMWAPLVTPKVNVFCAISNENVYELFFFEEDSVAGMAYLSMLVDWSMRQLQEYSYNFTFFGTTGYLLKATFSMAPSQRHPQ